MNKFLVTTAAAALFFSVHNAVALDTVLDENALEPCIDGGVSATGLFASQAEEDRFTLEQLALELEPCINGEVSADGRFTSQAEEDAWTDRLAGG
jgi:hypothetical protein